MNGLLGKVQFYTYRKTLLSLKTGLFQREVASKEESSI